VSERNQYQPGVPCWVDTLQADARGAKDFYAGVFGWEYEGPGPMPGDPPGEYFVARLRGRDVAGIGSQPAGGAVQLPSWNTYVSVASADDAAATAKEAGGAVLVDPFDADPAGRMAVLADPAGAAFSVWEPGVRSGAQLVNQPSAWSMSDLQTPDPDRAAAFYGDLFGWTTESFGPLTMFRLPGYVGGEPEQPVSREVIAVMSPAEGTPHWRPDFWIDDVEAAAATAKELGGSVISPPEAGPVGTSAVLADPSGVAFSVSRVVP
jgi:predicted enzyme related to lactoylglutathione lyase